MPKIKRYVVVFGGNKLCFAFTEEGARRIANDYMDDMLEDYFDNQMDANSYSFDDLRAYFNTMQIIEEEIE